MRELEAPKFELAKTGEELDMRDVTVIMPLAGLGMRAREVTKDAIPKTLIELEGGKTVLDRICEQLQEAGFRNFVFCVGHHKEQVIDHLSAEEWVQTEGVSYQFSEEETLSGVEGAVLNAVETLGLKGQAMIVPGDMLHDMDALVELNRAHKDSGAGITMGTTSYITERTGDVDKMVIEEGTNRLLWMFDRTEQPVTGVQGTANTTRIGVDIIDIDYFKDLCDQFLEANPHQNKNIGMRDTLGPWVIQMGNTALHAFETQAEVVDMGTPDTIYYGKANWRTINSRQEVEN